MSRFRLRLAADWLLAGGVVGYPTEAVFGLGCDPLESDAVEHILNLKGRDAGKGLILIGAEFSQVEPFLAPLTDEMRARIEPTWPGPVTWVLPAADWVPERLTGGRDTLAVRVTAHPGAADLCAEFGGAIVSTSANRSGQQPARTVSKVRAIFGEGVDDVLPGAVGGALKPTEIRDGVTGRVLRAA